MSAYRFWTFWTRCLGSHETKFKTPTSKRQSLCWSTTRIREFLHKQRSSWMVGRNSRSPTGYLVSSEIQMQLCWIVRLSAWIGEEMAIGDAASRGHAQSLPNEYKRPLDHGIVHHSAHHLLVLDHDSDLPLQSARCLQDGSKRPLPMAPSTTTLSLVPRHGSDRLCLQPLHLLRRRRRPSLTNKCFRISSRTL